MNNFETHIHVQVGRTNLLVLFVHSVMDISVCTNLLADCLVYDYNNYC